MNGKDIIKKITMIALGVYIFACALISHVWGLSKIDETVRVAMIVFSLLGCFLLVSHIKKPEKTEKPLIFMCVSLSIMWDVLLIVSL